MPSKKLIVFISFLHALFLGCNAETQLGGIVGEVKFNTQACVPQQKIINIRNDDTTNPQRVMGVYFELGTNEKNVFNIKKVVVGSSEYTPENAIAQEVLIPAGGIMSVYTEYKTRIPTNVPDTTYLDLFLNGPRLGILQVKLDGEAEQSPDCKPGESKRFRVVKVIQKIKNAQNQDVAANDITNVTEPFFFEVSGAKAIINKDGFPKITIPTPRIPLEADLDNGEFEGTFNEGNLEIRNVKVKAVLTVEVTLTTGSLTVESDLSDASLTLEGQHLSDGKMKVVLIAKLPEVSDLGALSKGLYGAIIELEEENE